MKKSLIFYLSIMVIVASCGGPDIEQYAMAEEPPVSVDSNTTDSEADFIPTVDTAIAVEASQTTEIHTLKYRYVSGEDVHSGITTVITDSTVVLQDGSNRASFRILSTNVERDNHFAFIKMEVVPPAWWPKTSEKIILVYPKESEELTAAVIGDGYFHSSTGDFSLPRMESAPTKTKKPEPEVSCPTTKHLVGTGQTIGGIIRQYRMTREEFNYLNRNNSAVRGNRIYAGRYVIVCNQ